MNKLDYNQFFIYKDSGLVCLGIAIRPVDPKEPIDVSITWLALTGDSGLSDNMPLINPNWTLKDMQERETQVQIIGIDTTIFFSDVLETIQNNSY